MARQLYRQRLQSDLLPVHWGFFEPHMKKNVLAYLACALAILLLDGLWLGVLAVDLYRTGIGHLMMDKPNFAAAAAFYVFYITGTLIFAIRPALAANNWTLALRSGALFGFFCYMTYEFTNMATLRDWPMNVVLIDLAWGTFITAVGATAGYAAAKSMRD